MSRYSDDPRVSGFGADGYTVSRDGTDFRVLPTEVFGWVVCTGPNLDFVAATGGGFAIGFPTAEAAIGAVLGEQPTSAATATDQPTAEVGTAADSDESTDGM